MKNKLENIANDLKSLMETYDKRDFPYVIIKEIDSKGVFLKPLRDFLKVPELEREMNYVVIVKIPLEILY